MREGWRWRRCWRSESARQRVSESVSQRGSESASQRGSELAGGQVGEGRRLPKLNENQLAVMAELAGCGGRELVRELRGRMGVRGVPESTLGTLVKRGLDRK